jgi:hypothetical protein
MRVATLVILGLGGVSLGFTAHAEQVTINPLKLSSSTASLADSPTGRQLNAGSNLLGSMDAGQQSAASSLPPGIGSASQLPDITIKPPAAGPQPYTTGAMTALVPKITHTEPVSMLVPTSLHLAGIASGAKTSLGDTSPTNRALNK